MKSYTKGASGRYPLTLLGGFWCCVVVAILVVFRRLTALIWPREGAPPQLAELGATFSAHAFLTIIHIVPAALFVSLAVRLLLRRKTAPWEERLFFALGLVTGLTAYAMSSYAVGGWIERSAVLVFNSWFLISLGRAFWSGAIGDSIQQRTWTTRAVGVLLGIATTRPIMGIFFATSQLTHLGPRDFFGIAFWIGFTINVVVVELWLHSPRRALLHQPAPVL